MMREQLKPPYKLFVADGQSPLHALSWRLQNAYTPVLPHAWILVIGRTATENVNVSTTLVQFGMEVGSQLAEANYGIVTRGGSYNSYLNEQTLRLYDTIYQRIRKAGNIRDYVRNYILENNRISEGSEAKSTYIKFLASDEDKMIEHLTSFPNACILISGNDEDLDLAMKCLQNGRPVFPIVESGGAAKKFYDLLLKNYKEDRIDAGSVFNMKINLKQIFQHPMDVEALDQPYKLAIDKIMSYLNRIYKEDEAKMHSGSGQE